MIRKFKILLIVLTLISVPLVAYAHTIYVDGVNTNITATVEGTNVIIPMTNQVEISGEQINILSNPPALPDVVVNIASIAGVTAPVKNAIPVTTITETAQYTGTVTWNPANSTFGASTVYTATITLTPKTGYTLVGVVTNFFTVAGATATNVADSGVITAVFPATAPPDVLQNLVEVNISVSDGTIQKAKFYASQALNKPLIIWLHTWGDTYNTLYEYQGVNLPEQVLLRDWNFIQPNFRGVNNNPDACASNKVITDIDSAISYAIANGHVDTSKIYVVGASGGGHAALSHFMRSTQNVVDGYYTWVPITDLMAWYYQTQDKSYEDYWLDISYSLSCDGVINVTEAKARSPLWNTTPLTKFNNTFIKMYAGIRDGYDGAAVPFSHSILMFNKLCKDRGLTSDRIPLDEMYYMIDNFAPSIQQNLGTLQGGRNILYTKSVPNLDLVIFDGHHEMIVQQAIWDIENEISQ